MSGPPFTTSIRWSRVNSDHQSLLLKNDSDRPTLRPENETAEVLVTRNPARTMSLVSPFASASEEEGKCACVNQTGFCRVLVLVFV